MAFPIVALLCSAGGLDALTTILAPLPADLPAAVLVLQHVSPDARSMLPQILDRRTDLPVAPATDGEPLRPGRVLVAPPGYHTLVATDLTVALIPSGMPPPSRPSADLLLTTLAVTARERVIAVVLSGGGHDAATGATAVHRFGGMVIAASPHSAEHASMPRATIDRDTITDHVTAVDEVPALLTALLTTPTIHPAAD